MFPQESWVDHASSTAHLIRVRPGANDTTWQECASSLAANQFAFADLWSVPRELQFVSAGRYFFLGEFQIVTIPFQVCVQFAWVAHIHN